MIIMNNTYFGPAHIIVSKETSGQFQRSQLGEVPLKQRKEWLHKIESYFHNLYWVLHFIVLNIEVSLLTIHLLVLD